MAGNKIFPIRFDGLKGSIECDEKFMKTEVRQWQRYLRHARDNKNTTIVTCCCLPEENEGIKRKLKVHLSQSSDQCYLSSFAFTGNEHSPECRFYSVWSDKRQAAIYAAGVVKVGANGVLTVRLQTGLQKKEASSTKPHAPAVKAVPQTQHRQPAMRLLGLLHLLWEQSGINTWHPAFDRRSRNPGWLTWRLQQTAAQILIAKTPLIESMLLMAFKNTQQAKENQLRTLAAESGKRRLIIVSMLASWTTSAEERLHNTLPLGIFSGFPDLHLPEDVLERLRRSYSRELSHWRAGSRVMVICETDPPEKVFKLIKGKNVPVRSCRIIDAALMTVSQRYVPLDSAYEEMVEKLLWQKKRAFIKPMRYDDKDVVLPDFILTDVRGAEAVPMEVFGMNTPEYLVRKNEKIAHYNKVYGTEGWWQWDVTDPAQKDKIPAFPAKNSSL